MQDGTMDQEIVLVRDLKGRVEALKWRECGDNNILSMLLELCEVLQVFLFQDPISEVQQLSKEYRPVRRIKIKFCQKKVIEI